MCVRMACCASLILYVKEKGNIKNADRQRRDREDNNMKMDKVIAAIIGMVVLDSIALMNGIDGTLMLIAVVAIAGLGGYELRDVVNLIKGEKPPPSSPSPLEKHHKVFWFDVAYDTI